MPSEVGSGQVAIFPTFKGFRKAVGGETEGAAKAAASRFGSLFSKGAPAAGQKAGRGVQQAFAASTKDLGSSALKQLNATVASSARAVSASRLKEQDAAGRVRVAEAALTAAKKKGVAGSSQLVAAEERLASASRKLDAAQETTKSSSEKLKAAQERLATATVAGNQKAAASTRLLLSSSLRGGPNLGIRAGSAFGSGFLGGFKKALAPLAAVAVAYLGIQGITRAVRSFTGYIRDSISAIGDWQVLNAQSGAVVRSTGGAARVSAKHIHELAESIEDTTSTQAEQIQQGANLVATFKNIRNGAGKNNKIYDKTVLAAVNMARALGKDVPSAAMQLSKALNDPVKGLTKLQRAGVTFTDQQVAQVKALVANGKTMEAQKVILREVNSEFGKSGAAYANTLPGKLYTLRDAFGDVGEKIATGLTPGLGKLATTFTGVLKKFGQSKQLDGFVAGLSGRFGKLADKVAAVVKLIAKLTDPDRKAGGGTFLDQLSSGLGTIFPLLKPVIGLFKQIGPSLADAATTVGPALGKALTDLAPTIADLLPHLTTLVVQALPVLVDLLKVIAPILGFVADNWAGFFGAVQSIIDLLKNPGDLQGFLNTATALPGVFGAAVRAVIPFGTWLGKTIGAAVRFGVVVGSTISQVVGFFASLPGQIGSALSGAGRWLVDTGKHIVQGLIDGVSSMITRAVNAVKNVGGKMLAGVKSFLGIHSPSTVFRDQVGVQIGAGVEQGILSTVGRVQAATSRLVSAPLASSPSAQASSPSGGSSSAPGGVTIINRTGVAIRQIIRDGVAELELDWANGIVGGGVA